MHSFCDLTYFRGLGQKYKTIFVRFLVQMKTLLSRLTDLYDIWHSVSSGFNLQINKKVLLLLPYIYMIVNSILELLKNVVKISKEIFKGFISDFTHSFNKGFTQVHMHVYIQLIFSSRF